MSYAQLEAAAPLHPKIVGLSDAAFRAWVCGLCYSQAHLLDGRLPAGALRAFGTAVTEAVAAELVAAGLWEPVEANGRGYQVHDYLAWNASRAEVEARRAKFRAKRRKAAAHPPGPPLEEPYVRTQRNAGQVQGTHPERTPGTPLGTVTTKTTPDRRALLHATTKPPRGPWTCPHDPVCHTRHDCDTLLLLAQVKAQARP